MNRSQRRAQEALARKGGVSAKMARRASASKETRVHEAGHAVGHLLTSRFRGHAPEEAVNSIEMGPVANGHSRDGKVRLTSLAVCLADMVSADFMEAVREVIGDGEVNDGEVWDAFCVAGTLRDRQANFWSRILVSSMGAAAEAKLKGDEDPLPLFRSYTCEGDRLDVWRNCRVLGIMDERQIEVRNHFLRHARALVDRPSVWAAINAIADELQVTMRGSRVAALGWPHLEADVEVFECALPEGFRIPDLAPPAEEIQAD